MCFFLGKAIDCMLDAKGVNLFSFLTLFIFPYYPLLHSLGLFALFTSAAFHYETDKRIAGAVIACTALYVMNFAYSVRQQGPTGAMSLVSPFEKQEIVWTRCHCDLSFIFLYSNYLGNLTLIFLSIPSFQWGPLAWVVAAEIFPQRLRGKGMTITTLANWITNFCIAKAVPVMILPAK